MKKLFSFVLMFLLISTVVSAQTTMTFDVFESKATEVATGIVGSRAVDFQITINDYYLILGTAKTYTFTSEPVFVTDKKFYSYATDNDNGSNCRIWFTAYSSVRADFEIEYSDFIFRYKTNRVK